MTQPARSEPIYPIKSANLLSTCANSLYMTSSAGLRPAGPVGGSLRSPSSALGSLPAKPNCPSHIELFVFRRFHEVQQLAKPYKALNRSSARRSAKIGHSPNSFTVISPFCNIEALRGRASSTASSNANLASLNRSPRLEGFHASTSLRIAERPSSPLVASQPLHLITASVSGPGFSVMPC